MHEKVNGLNGAHDRGCGDKKVSIAILDPDLGIGLADLPAKGGVALARMVQAWKKAFEPLQGFSMAVGEDFQAVQDAFSDQFGH